MTNSILRVLMCCWLLISQTGIDTSCCRAAVVTASVEKRVEHHEPVDEQVEEAKAAPRVLIVNGLGQVIRDDSVCASGSRVAVKTKTRVVSKPGCHCSLTKKLAGKCCCSVSTVTVDEEASDTSSSTNPCGEFVGGGCECADEVGTMVVLRMPTVLGEPCVVSLDGGLDVVVLMVDDEIREASLEPAVDPPELG